MNLSNKFGKRDKIQGLPNIFFPTSLKLYNINSSWILYDNKIVKRNRNLLCGNVGFCHYIGKAIVVITVKA